MEAKKQTGFGKKLISTVTRNPIVFLLVIAAIVVGCLVDNFFSWANLSNLMSNTAIRFLIALGVSGCLITKGTDLSAGRQVGLAAVIAGIMYAVAGYLLAAKSGGASASMGQGYELEAIAGCTIGGVSTTGGIGTVPGILIGVLVFELLKIILQFLGVNPYYNYVVQGLVIVLAVSLDIRKYIAKK